MEGAVVVPEDETLAVFAKLQADHQRMVRHLLPNLALIGDAYRAAADQVAVARAVYQALQPSITAAAEVTRTAQQLAAYMADVVTAIERYRPQLEEIGRTVQSMQLLPLLLARVTTNVVLPFTADDDNEQVSTAPEMLSKEEAGWWSWVLFFLLACLIAGDHTGLAAKHGVEQAEGAILGDVPLLLVLAQRVMAS